MIEPQNITSDTFFDGRLLVYQSRNGYRYSLDAVLLAGVVHPKPGQVLVDLGTGCGIIPLILAIRYADIFLHGIEIQDELAQLADMNIRANQMQDRIDLIHKDIRHLTDADIDRPVDWVISNPPYRRSSTGRINPSDQKAVARHEIGLDLHQLIQASRHLLKTRGRFTTIFPADRTADLLYIMRDMGIEPKWLQSIHSRDGESARLILVHGIKAGKPGLAFAAPLVIYNAQGGYTPEVQCMFAL